MRQVKYFPDGIETIITIEGGLIGMRLDQVLQFHYKEASRSSLLKLIKDDQIKIFGCKGKLKPSLKMQKGAVLRLFKVRSSEPIFDKKIDVLYEDEDIFVINKPSGAPVHPAGRYQYETITIYFELEKKKPLFPVHRLDRETSGVLVLAKNSESAAALTQSMQNREINKFYLAKSEAPLFFGHAHVKLPIGRDEKSEIRLKQAIIEGGNFSETEILKLSNFISLIQLHTGRQHQIRVVLNTLHCPIEGDNLYGLHASDELWDQKTRQSLEALKRNEVVPPDDHLRLHCCQMAVGHPRTKENLTFQCFPSWLEKKDQETALRYLSLQ